MEYLVDQSEDIGNPGRQLGGAPENQRWIVFQPFDVPAGGWTVGAIRLNGVTWTYRPERFTATVLPDTGGDYPDESQPLAAGDAFFRFGVEWVEILLAVELSEGRHWLRLSANDDNHYLASVSTNSEGLPSMSRSSLGNDFPGMPPIALRLLPSEDLTAAPPAAVRALSLRLLSPNPSTGRAVFETQSSGGEALNLSVYDVQGRLVRELIRSRGGAESLRVTWDGAETGGRESAAGVYFARLTNGSEQRSVKLLRLE